MAFGRDVAKPALGAVTVSSIPVQSPETYKSLLNTAEKAEQKRTAVPIPKLGRENRNILWLNINDFCKAIHREPAAVIKYVADETLFNLSACANGVRMYKAKINEAKLQTILKKFIKEFVMCRQCKSINTDADRCLDCQAIHRLD